MAGVLQAGPPAPVTANGQPTAPSSPTLDDWISRPNEAAIAVADQRLAAALGPVEKALASAQAMNATTQRALAARDHADAFAKWGPEIDGHMAQVAPEHRTLDNYGKVVKFVMGNHLDELVEAKAKAMLASGGLGERANGANGAPNTQGGGYQPDKLGAFGEMCKAKGLAEPDVINFCKRNNMTVEQWMQHAQGGKMFTSSSPFQITMTDAQLGIKGTFGE